MSDNKGIIFFAYIKPNSLIQENILKYLLHNPVILWYNKTKNGGHL